MYGLEPTQLLEDKRLSPINDHLTQGLLAVSSCRLLHICEVIFQKIVSYLALQW